MSTQTTTLPELPEADATGAIADIYASMRRLTGAPMVALIWRHLATRPNVLEAVWEAIGPLYFSGALQSAAWPTAQRNVTGEPASLGRRGLDAAGLDASACASYVRILDAYNRVNPVNFVAVQLVLMGLTDDRRGSRTAAAAPHHDWQPPSPIVDIPAMVAIADIPPATRAMIDAMTTDPAIDRSTVVPTLYRHFTDWPQLIPAIYGALRPRFDSGEMTALSGAVAAALRQEAAQLLGSTGPLAQTDATRAIIPTLQRFSLLIPEMVVVGALLRRGLEEG